jgi:hypothetical protein
MALRAVVSLIKVDASVDHSALATSVTHSALAASVTHTAATLNNLKLEYVPKNQIFTDPVGAADQYVLAATLAKNDTTTLSDAPTWSLSKAATNSLGVSDVASLSFSMLTTDVATMTDLVPLLVQKNLNEQLATSDQSQWALQKDAADMVAFTELLTYALEQSHADNIPLIEIINKSTRRPLFDAAGVSDLAVRLVNKNPNDPVTMGDSTPTFVIDKGLADSALLSEVATITTQFSRTFADAFALDDTSHVDKNWDATKNNVTHVTDVTSFTLTRDISDSFPLGDAPHLVFAKGTTDSLGVSDTINVQIFAGSPPLFGAVMFNQSIFG